MTTTDLPTSKALTELGMRPDPALKWYDAFDNKGRECVFFNDFSTEGGPFLYRPHPVEALDWLAERFGWVWSSDATPRMWWADKGLANTSLYPTPAELITDIIARIRKGK